MEFKDCKIIVKSERDKKEFLAMCKYLHDFSVFFEPGSNITVQDDMSKKAQKLNTSKTCGVSLDFEKNPFLNFLVGLHDSDDKNFADKFIAVKK